MINRSQWQSEKRSIFLQAEYLEGSEGELSNLQQGGVFESIAFTRYRDHSKQFPFPTFVS
jgi:hypothetical protein